MLQYKTVDFIQDEVLSCLGQDNDFTLNTASGKSYVARKLLFTTGVKDLMPDINGFAECWGISVLHCPYCHGYEVSNEEIGIIANGETAFEMGKLIHHWSKNLSIFTNGVSNLTEEQSQKFIQNNIEIIEHPISEIAHENGYVKSLIFENGSKKPLKALFSRVPFKQHCEIPEERGCTITDEGYIKTDDLQRTTIAGIYAAGDNNSPLRAVSVAVAAGTKAGAFINKEMIDESF